MRAESIFSGAYYVSAGDHALLAGCPPEIVKVLIQKGLPTPNTLLLPDVGVSQGESQVAVEFPFYHHTFNRCAGAGFAPLRLVGRRARVDAAEELLRLTLFGPSRQEMIEWGETPASAEALAREMAGFHFKDKDGKTPSMRALIEKVALDNAPVDLGWAVVDRLRTNVFQVTGTDGAVCELDLNLSAPQRPPYPVSVDLTPTSLVKLGIEVLGGATGFSAAQASSGLALCYNGQYLLIDAIPYLYDHLHARGIARNQVQALFLSHIHDDHCNLVSLLQHNRRVRLLTTPLIYRMALRKLALCLDRSEDSLAGYFEFVALAPGQTANYFGLRITPFYSSHSVPTIGAHFETAHDGVDYRIIFTGDTQSLADLRRMRRSGAISSARYDEIASRYRQAAHLFIADGGEGAIHGDPADSLSSPAERVVILHSDQLPERFDAHFSAASSGKRFAVLAGDTDYDLTRTIEFLLEYFPDMPPRWISHLLSNAHVLKYNRGDIVIREGAQSEGRVYMLLTGHVTVLHHDGVRRTVLAQMGAGEIIGEMSIIAGHGIRNASVVAQTPSIVTALSELAFREYVEQQSLTPILTRMWQQREVLQKLPCLRGLSASVIRALSLHVTREELAPSAGGVPLTRLASPGSLLLPLDDRPTRLRRGRTEQTVPPWTPLLCEPNVRLTAHSKWPYLRLESAAANQLRGWVPAFRFFWEETLGLPVTQEK